MKLGITFGGPCGPLLLELPHCFPSIGQINDAVPFEHGVCFPAAYSHAIQLTHSSAAEIAGSGAAQIVKQQPTTPRRFASQAKKGKEKLKANAERAQGYAEEIKRYAREAGEIPGPEVRSAVIRKRLFDNVIEGKDRGVQSCKLAGMDREINLFVAEQQQGIIIINSPPKGLSKAILNDGYEDDGGELWPGCDPPHPAKPQMVPEIRANWQPEPLEEEMRSENE